MYLEQRIEKLEALVAELIKAQPATQGKKEPELEFPLYWRHDGSDEVGVINNQSEYDEIMSIKNDIVDIVSREVYDQYYLPPAKKETKPKTIDDVREATSAVIKADSNKKQAVRDLLETFGAAKVTDLKEDQYADFITKVAEV